MIEREVSAENAPYVWDHLVDGVPTLPGVFLMILIAEAALELRPNLKITAFEDAAFRRFVRMRREGTTTLRLHASVISEDAESTLVRGWPFWLTSFTRTELFCRRTSNRPLSP